MPERPMSFVSRQQQRDAAGVTRAVEVADALADGILDGLEVPLTVEPRNWRLEHQVHGSEVLADGVDNTRNYVSAQVNIVRDEIRYRTWCAAIQAGRLSLFQVATDGISSQELGRDVWRSHIALNKFSGEIAAAWISKYEDANELWFSNRQLATAARQPDFPFFAYSQAPIGHVQCAPPAFGLLTYKDRSTGKLYIRGTSGGTVHDETVVVAPTATVGGLSIAISGEHVLGVIDAVVDGKLVPMSALSTDGGSTFTGFEPIEFTHSDRFEPVASSGPPVVDFGGYFHVPLTVQHNDSAVALNAVMNEAVVEATIAPGPQRRLQRAVDAPRATLAAFPKKAPAFREGSELLHHERFGNSVTDGFGLIMVLLAEGQLFTSNSQSGGISFPEKAHLNHEMPTVAAYAATECYTSGRVPNTVSMDYVYLESDEELGAPQHPMSRALHFETWDMPLPTPQVTATAQGATVHVRIDADADFSASVNETTFSIDNPAIAVTSIEIQDNRNAVIGTDSNELAGATITFEVRTLFLHHRGSAQIALG